MKKLGGKLKCIATNKENYLAFSKKLYYDKKKKNFIKPQYNNAINTQHCGRLPEKTNVHHAGHLNKKNTNAHTHTHTEKKR